MFVTFILFLYIVEAVFWAVKKLILIQSLIIYTWIMKRCIVLFITFCCAVVSNAQTNGIVTDGEKGLPLAGVNIYLQKDSVYTQ